MNIRYKVGLITQVRPAEKPGSRERHRTPMLKCPWRSVADVDRARLGPLSNGGPGVAQSGINLGPSNQGG